MADISGYGLKINVLASFTFPVGTIITQFADDADPFDVPSMQIADKAMGSNGDLITWSKANPIIITINLIPNTPDDINMGILFESNRVGKGKLAVTDIITLTGIYPDGKTITYQNGRLTDGMPGNAVASSARLKTKTYSFAFENKVGA